MFDRGRLCKCAQVSIALITESKKYMSTLSTATVLEENVERDLDFWVM